MKPKKKPYESDVMSCPRVYVTSWCRIKFVSKSFVISCALQYTCDTRREQPSSVDSTRLLMTSIDYTVVQ